MSDLTGTLSVDISGLGGGNPLPFELVSAEALTAASDTGVATATYTGPTVDLGTVASVFTLVTSAASASFSPSLTGLPVSNYGYEDEDYTSEPQLGTYSVALQGSLDGENWYSLGLSVGGAIYTPDGSTAVFSSGAVSVADNGPTASTLTRYLQGVATLTLSGAFYYTPNWYENEGPWSPTFVTSLAATLTAYVGVQL